MATFARSGGQSLAWHGPRVETTWQAGPFSFPVAAADYVEERHGGDVTVHSVGGTSRLVYGPWRVVIRGLAASATRRILAVWETYRSWDTREAAGAPHLVGRFGVASDAAAPGGRPGGFSRSPCGSDAPSIDVVRGLTTCEGM